MQATGIAALVVSGSYAGWLLAALVMGLGTALVYPTLIAAISDHAHPNWRASAVGVYRLWRDLGYAVGALLVGVVADLVTFDAAILVVAVLTACSAGVVATRMREADRVTYARAD